MKELERQTRKERIETRLDEGPDQMQRTEADARIIIDRLLREAGWDIEDKAQVLIEEHTVPLVLLDDILAQQQGIIEELNALREELSHGTFRDG